MATLNTTIAVRYDFVVKQNQTFNPLLTFLNDDDDPIDLSGTTIKFSVRARACGCGTHGCSAGDSNYNQVYKQDFIPTITGTGNNQLQFNDDILLATGTYVYDMIVVWPNGNKQYYLKGTFKVEKSHAYID
jgi:hypothetical protein